MYASDKQEMRLLLLHDQVRTPDLPIYSSNKDCGDHGTEELGDSYPLAQALPFSFQAQVSKFKLCSVR